MSLPSESRNLLEDTGPTPPSSMTIPLAWVLKQALALSQKQHSEAEGMVTVQAHTERGTRTSCYVLLRVNSTFYCTFALL